MYKIILVDDETLSLKIFSRLIEKNRLGFELTAAFDNARDAIAYVSENHVDVIISDISMPGIDGLKFLEYIKQNHSDIVFIILTGYKNFEYMKFAISHSAAEYLTKPLDIEELNTVLERVKAGLDKAESNASAEYSEVMCHRALTEWLSGEAYSEKKLLSELNEAGLSISGTNAPLAIVRTTISNIDEVIAKFRYGPSRLHTALIQMLCMNSVPVLSLNYSISSMNMILFSSGDCESFEEYISTVLEEFENNCRQLLSVEITATAAELFAGLEDARSKIVNILNITPDASDTGIKNKHIRSALKYIDENYTRDISLSEVSAYLHLNPVHFSKLFKANVGCTFVKFLTSYRLEKAQYMLLNTFMTISEISSSTGFSNTNNFHRVFKKAMGMSPQVYRNTQIGKNITED